MFDLSFPKARIKPSGINQAPGVNGVIKQINPTIISTHPIKKLRPYFLDIFNTLILQ